MASDPRAAFDETEQSSSGSGDELDLDLPGAEPDYYAILGVSPTATDDEIHHAFRRLAKLWHPDRFTAAPPALRARAERRMRAVIRARDVLTDPISRHQYDARRTGSHAAELPLHPAARPIHMPYTPPPFFGAGSMAHYERHTVNPNGAGQFFGVLALILALGLAASAANGRFGDGIGEFVAFALMLGLFLLAGILFTDSSILARAATHFMETEPAPARQRRAPSHSGVRHAGHHHAGNHHQRLHQKVRNRAKSPSASGPRTDASPPPGGPGHDGAASQSDPEQPGDSEFDQLVKQALEGVPDEFQPWLENVVVQVAREPSRRQLLEMQVRPNCTLLGLYVGVPVTHHAHFTGHGAPPEIITIFQGPIERYARHDPERVKEQVRRTVLHELAHHFGMSHEAMPAWIR